MSGNFNPLIAVLRWMTGLFFLLLGISTFSSQIVSALFSAVLGLILIPPTGQVIFSRIKLPLNRGLKFVMAFVLLVLTFITTPSAKTQTPTSVSSSPTPIVETQSPIPSVSPTPELTPSPTPSPSPIQSPSPKSISPKAAATTPPTYNQNSIIQPTQQTGGYACNCSKTCDELSCAEAQYQLNECGCSRRDGDGDGVACDRQCGG